MINPLNIHQLTPRSWAGWTAEQQRAVRAWTCGLPFAGSQLASTYVALSVLVPLILRAARPLTQTRQFIRRAVHLPDNQS
jgi:hypothetical protein